MKFLLTIEAHGSTPDAAIRYVRGILDASVKNGKPIGFVMGDSAGSAGSTWRVLTCTDEGDDTTQLRPIPDGQPSCVCLSFPTNST